MCTMLSQPDIEAGTGERILIIGDAGEDSDPGGAGRSPGPAWSLAETLSRGHDIILAVPRLTKASHPRFAVIYYNRRNIGLIARDCDIVIFSPGALEKNPSLAKTGPLVAVPAHLVKEGNFRGVLPVSGPAEPQSQSAGSGDLLVLRPLPVKIRNPWPSRFLARLRGRARRAMLKARPWSLP